MEQQRIVFTLLSGLIAGTMGFLPGAGDLFIAWAPFIPLFFVGLAFGARSAAQSGAVAIITAIILGGGGEALTVALFVVLPSSFLIGQFVSYRVTDMGRIEWYPVLRTLSHFTLLAAAIFMFFAISASLEHKNSLQDMLGTALRPDVEGMDPLLAERIRELTTEWSFFLLAAVAWIWVLITWLMAVMVNHALVTQHKAIRPSLGITPAGMPAWLPALLVVSAGLALVGQGNDTFAGKTVFLILLLPYFLSGMARIHAMSHYWQARRFYLFLIYVILIGMFWSTALVAALGLYHHLSEMLDKRQKIR